MGVHRKRLWVISFLVISGFGWVLYNLPMGSDWHLFFYKVTMNYILGETRLYDTGGVGVHNPPWVLLVLMPFGLLPETTGLLAFRVLGILVFAWSAVSLGSYRGSSLMLVAPIVSSIAVWDTLVSGNIDFVALAGIVLAWNGVRKDSPYLLGLGVTVAFTKPQLAVIPFLVLLPEIRRWSCGLKFKMLTIPSLAVVSSFLLAGIDWPWRLVTSVAERNDDLMGVSMTLPHALELLVRWVGWPMWIPSLCAVLIALFMVPTCWGVKDLRQKVALGVALGPLIMPYMWSGSLSLSMVAAWPRLLDAGRYRTATILYLAQYLLILRGILGWGGVWVLVPFSIGLFLALLRELPCRTGGAES